MSASASPFVRFIDVQKSYDGETLVVKNLNLELGRGEFLTLLGPSGSGKTTALMMLAGFESVTHGQITLEERPLNDVPPHRRDIGMVFQNYALFPHMTVWENVAYPLKVRRVPRGERDERVRKALDMVKLGHLGSRRPAQLSGGQQQRVALARALVFQPKLVLLDEPLGALDKQLREHMQLEIKHIHENVGVAMVYVTHDQSEALTMSDRIVVFNDGHVQQVDPPAELYERPKNSFVANFIGENNRLDGTVRSLDGDRCRVALEDGSEIVALPVHVEGAGARTTLSIRPERILLEPPEVDGMNRLTGRVLEPIYHGDHVRLRLSIAGSDEFTVKVPVGEAMFDLKPGREIRVGWKAQDCRALDPV
jgi:putative spermidine/putrescine transport system ATP-binding protein